MITSPLPTRRSHQPAGLEDAAETTDEQLLHACAAGHDPALQVLYRRHAALIRTIALRVVSNDVDADEIVQDVFLEIWNQAERFCEGKGTALAWMTTLARRRAIDRLRRRMAYVRARDRYREGANIEIDIYAPQSADGAAITADRATALRKVVESLPTAQQEAVELAYYKGLSQRQISSQTGVPLGTIKTRLELALRKIRAAISTPDGGVAEWAFTRA